MRIKLFLFALAAASMAHAATLTADEPVKLAVPGTAYNPVLSPEGETLLFSTQDHTGLKAMDLLTDELTIIDEGAAAGFNPVFSADGKQVFYQTASMVGGLMNKDVKRYDLPSATKGQISAPSRKQVEMPSLKSATYACSDYDHINVVLNGEKSKISPLEDAHSYLWASLSPNGDKILFAEPFTGVYVCNADGSAAQKLLSKGDYPCWLGEEYVLAVIAKDDGQDILEARIVAVEVATGKTTNLTSEYLIVGEISADLSADKVAFSTTSGEMYVMNIKISE